jgi:uncharacterized membrane protein
MATFTVLEFETADGAENMVRALGDLQRRQLLTIQDAAIVTWPKGKRKPKTRQLTNLTAAGALNGAFWGMLFGLIFFVPLLGMAIGASMGALTGSMADFGVDDALIKKLRSEITEGTSALFLLSATQVPERVVEELRAQNIRFTVLASNLSSEQEAKLQAAFAEEE